jgi:hypothetical protein
VKALTNRYPRKRPGGAGFEPGFFRYIRIKQNEFHNKSISAPGVRPAFESYAGRYREISGGGIASYINIVFPTNEGRGIIDSLPAETSGIPQRLSRRIKKCNK